MTDNTIFTMRNTFGKILRELRTEKGLSQADLGKIMHLANNTISSWERGNSYPNLDELALLAKFFDVSADYLLGLEE